MALASSEEAADVMANPSPGQPPWLNRDPKCIWRCPCGYEDNYRAMLGHRKGIKTHPACASGRIEFVRGANGETEDVRLQPGQPGAVEWPQANPNSKASRVAPQDTPLTTDVQVEPDLPTSPQPAGPPGDDGPSLASAFDLKPDGDLGEDPEEMARQLNLEKAVEAVVGRDGHAGGNGTNRSADLPPGDLRVEQPDQPQISQAREVVSLPWFVRGMYDWARAKGWHVGDGTISAFVADCLIDHFTTCWGKAIVVVNRDDVQLVTK